MITGIRHANVICSDFNKSWEFYIDKLGGIPDRDKKSAMAWRIPDADAQTIHGLEEPAQWYACLISYGEAGGDTIIDLLHFVKPATTGKPNNRLNNVGISRICLNVEDIDKAYNKLKAEGIEFISPPIDLEMRMGQPPTRTCNCKDPDGIIITLEQHPVGLERITTGIRYISVVCTDLKKSLEFYCDKLGGIPDLNKSAIHKTIISPNEKVAKAFGFDELAQWSGCLVRFSEDEEATALNLEQFMKPPVTGKAYDKVNNVGLTRMCFHVDDVDKMYNELKEKGVDFVSPPIETKSPTRGLFKACDCKDPDGIEITIE